MRPLREKLEQGALQTEWSGWFRTVLHAFGQVDVMRSDTWKVLAPLAEPVAAVRWLVASGTATRRGQILSAGGLLSR